MKTTRRPTVTVQDFCGMDLFAVRAGGLLCQGTAPRGGRPSTWTVTLGRVALSNVAAGELRAAFPLRGRTVAAVLRAVETGRL